MTTTVTKSIGNSGRDYTSIMAALTALNTTYSGNLVTADVLLILELYTGEIVSTTQQSYPTFTTDATRYITIRAATGNGIKDTVTNPVFYNAALGAAMKSTYGSGSGDASFIFPSAYTRIIGIQFKQAGSLNGAAVRITGANSTLDGSIITSSSGPCLVFESDNGVCVRNALVAVSANNVIATGYATGALCYFNTIYSATTVSVDSNSNPVYGIVGINNAQTFTLCKNNAIFGFTNPFGSAISTSSANNATDQTSFSVGSSNVTSLSFASCFVSSGDLTAKSGSGLLAAGVTISGYTTDIFGRTLTSPPAIGASIYPAPVAATGITMTGPTTGTVGSASTNFSVGVTPVGSTITGTVVVTPSDASGGGTFTPTSLSLTTGSPSGTFTYNAASAGAKTISETNNGSLTNASNITYTASVVAATVIAVSGPASGLISVASANFTASANGTITGTVVITPSDSGGGGTFSPTTVSISSGTPTATFTYTPASIGAKAITFTNNGSLTNQSTLTYSVSSSSVTVQWPQALKNINGGLRVGEACRIDLYDKTTGVLVHHKTGLTTHATTAVPPSYSASGPAAGVQYRGLVIMDADGAEGIELVTPT